MVSNIDESREDNSLSLKEGMKFKGLKVTSIQEKCMLQASPTKSTTMASSTTTTANDGDSKRKVALLTGITGQDGSTQLSKSFNKLHYADLTDA
ncbi:hypothetical protein LguiA_028089 [Lonicera macranthoides]